MKLKTIKLLITLCLLWIVWILIWHFQAPIKDRLALVFPSFSYVYLSADESLRQIKSNSRIEQIAWESLIPPQHRQVLQRYQTPTAMNLAENILLSLNASTDQAYRNAMFSTEIVEQYIDTIGSISGFIVPLEVADHRTLLSFFFVPYFGACTHYPPPPPNQIIYVRLADDFKIPDLNQAYTITGRFISGLYEDPLGTSAYQLELMSIQKFVGQPDDFREH